MTLTIMRVALVLAMLMPMAFAASEGGACAASGDPLSCALSGGHSLLTRKVDLATAVVEEEDEVAYNKMQDNRCPFAKPFLYPGTGRCFPQIWSGQACSNKRIDDLGASACGTDFSDLPSHGHRTANGCPSGRPFLYPGTERCFKTKWEEACNKKILDDADWTACRFDEDASEDITVYQTTTVTFGPTGNFKEYMYTNICPLAAAEMKECYRCLSKDGTTCVEYQAFASTNEFTQYKTYAWLPDEMMAKFKDTGSSITEYTDATEMNVAEFSYAVVGSSCERVFAP